MAFQDAAAVSADLLSANVATFTTSASSLTDPSSANHLGRKSYIDAGDIWVRIADTAITAVASIDVEWTEGAYRALRFAVTGVLPGSAGTTNQLSLRMKIGGTYLTGASDYSRQRHYVDNGTATASTDLGSLINLQINNNNANNDEGSVFGDVDPGASNMEAGVIFWSRWSSTNGRAIMYSAGMSPTEGACSGLRFLWNNGANFLAQGRILVQGLK